MSSLSISSIVDVNVNVLPGGANVETGCNKGLIVGDSTHISASERVVEYSSLAAMIDDSFLLTDPEYLAAAAYFAQTPAPTSVYIGRQDAEEDEAITAAVMACLEVAPEVYGVYACGVSDADILLLAAAIDGLGKYMLFFENTNADCLKAEPAAPDIFKALGTATEVRAAAERAIGIYSNTAYAGAALLGVAMGRETGRENSAFNLAYATLTGVDTEDVTQAELDILLAKYGNAYVQRGQSYELLHMGRCVNGSSYDDVMYLDMAQKVIEAKVMDVMVGNNVKTPQTDAGMGIIIAAVANGMEFMRAIGYVAEGVWKGSPFRDLNPGDVVPGGYLIYAESFSSMSQSDRELRKAPPVYVAMKTSGSIESVVINVNVNL